jgi:hypothetical protein
MKGCGDFGVKTPPFFVESGGKYGSFFLNEGGKVRIPYRIKKSRFLTPFCVIAGSLKMLVSKTDQRKARGSRSP